MSNTVHHYSLLPINVSILVKSHLTMLDNFARAIF